MSGQTRLPSSETARGPPSIARRSICSSLSIADEARRPLALMRKTHLDPRRVAPYAPSVGTIQSLERGLRILDALAEADADPMRHQRGVPISGLAAELDVHRTTAMRLVRTLVEAGYASPVEGRQGYRLGPAMRRDAVLSIGTQRFRRAARPFLQELVDRTGECAHAAVPDGDRALVIDDVETERPLRVVATQRAARRAPLHVGGQVPSRVRPRRAAGLPASSDRADDHGPRRPRAPPRGGPRAGLRVR